jgi:hypothetical protein
MAAVLLSPSSKNGQSNGCEHPGAKVQSTSAKTAKIWDHVLSETTFLPRRNGSLEVLLRLSTNTLLLFIGMLLGFLFELLRHCFGHFFKSGTQWKSPYC